MGMPWELVILFLTVLLGSCLQRIGGMGLGLVSGPIVALLFGPVQGVLVVNVLAFINAAALTTTVWRNIQWRRFVVIAPGILMGAIPAIFLIGTVRTVILQAIVGFTLLVALLIVTLLKRFIPPVKGKIPAFIAGVGAGFMNTVAAIAGPSITVYAQAARWEPRAFTSTLQPLYVVAGAVSLSLKFGTGAANFGSISMWVWVVGILGLTAGISLGTVISGRVPRNNAYKLALSLAVIGSATVFIKGLVGVLST
ncbi:sulfite exporter TauE/SafE family protein [Corynebacterium caspium]|uniref:sulfite exporter TauE/SafE family protein n=1 Tax=Corynebacterium caspium TaxID=234828 RepID=UPI00036BDEEC|nr:sulfite exporter TauE/SafE family protein [Corynebacterium caspium]WKD59391.1 Sulfite exporter TauE/SafE [Corynebacterium caspium DSM 44850]